MIASTNDRLMAEVRSSATALVSPLHDAAALVILAFPENPLRDRS
jgi:hypothetical protein